MIKAAWYRGIQSHIDQWGRAGNTDMSPFVHVCMSVRERERMKRRRKSRGREREGGKRKGNQEENLLYDYGRCC